MKVVSKTPAGIQPVYDLSIPLNTNFTLANGLVAHNCFNRSHSVSYSFITYACAWLKANYPVEFFTSLMSVRSQSLQPQDWAQKAQVFILEAQELGVEILPPYINTSEIDFTIHENKIFFGLSAIRDVKRAANYILKARGTSPFKDIKDFITRINTNKVNTKVFTALVKAGAFDRLGYRRKDLLTNVEAIYNWTRDVQEYHERKALNIQRERENINLSQQIEKKNLLRNMSKKKSERELTEDETKYLEETRGMRLHKLFELEAEPPQFPEIQRYPTVSLSVEDIIDTGDYIGCHIIKFPGRIIFPDTTKISNILTSSTDSVCGIVNSIKIHTDKNKQQMAFVQISDETGTMEVIIFASVFTKMKQKEQIPEAKDIIRVFGRIDEKNKMLARDISIYRSPNDSSP